jgi:HAD superfamily hydrolase (TIGR01509 family)
MITQMPTIDAIIFDLDGTLTEPILDFDRIRREIGLDRGPVWEAIVAMPPAERQRAEDILLEHELHAARICRLQPNALNLLSALQKRGLGLAILTRNCRASWEIVRDRFNLAVEQIYAREDGPMKPDPTAVVYLARTLNVELSRTLVVGDYLFDIQAGKAAGTRTALLVNHGTVPEYAAIADYVIHDLMEILDLIDLRPAI